MKTAIIVALSLYVLYLFATKRRVGPDRADVEKLDKLADQTTSEWEALTAQTAEIGKEVEKRFQDMWWERISASLRRTPVADLRRFSSGSLRTNALEQAGITRISQIVGFASADFMQINGIGPKTAPPLVAAVRRSVESAGAENPPVLQESDTAAVALLSSLERYRLARDAEESLAKYRGWIGRLRELRDQMKPLRSNRAWRSASKEQREAALKAFEQLTDQLHSDAAEYVRKHGRVPAAAAVRADVKRRFASDPRPYVTLLRRIIPGAPVQVGGTGRSQPAPSAGKRGRPEPGRTGGGSPGRGLRASSATRIGPYTVVKELGEGAFGKTYLATNADGVQVALKVLKPEHATNPSLRQTIEREIQAGDRINSRHFARILNHDLGATHPWVAQQFVPGTTLTKLIERGRLSTDRVARIADQLALALYDLERFRVVHSDLKPDNIQVSDNDTITILDLGVSWVPGIVETGGTLIYSPPESLQDAKPSPAADRWAVGLIIAQLLTAQHAVLSAARLLPGFRTDPRAAILAVVESAAIDLSGVPSTWMPLVRSLTDRDPSRRPDAQSVRRMVVEAVGGPEHYPMDEWVEGLSLMMRHSLKRGHTICLSLGDESDNLYMQWASNGDHLQVEVVHNQWVGARWQTHREQDRVMQRLGFEPPSDPGGNWWTMVSDLSGYIPFDEAAEMMIKAFLEVYRVPADLFAAEIGDQFLAFLDSPNAWFNNRFFGRSA